MQTLIILTGWFWWFASILNIHIEMVLLVKWVKRQFLLQILIEDWLIVQFEWTYNVCLMVMFRCRFLIASLRYFFCDLFGHRILIGWLFLWYLIYAFFSLIIHIIKGIHVRDNIRLMQSRVAIFIIVFWIHHSNLLYKIFSFFKFLNVNYMVTFQFVFQFQLLQSVLLIITFTLLLHYEILWINYFFILFIIFFSWLINPKGFLLQLISIIHLRLIFFE